MLLPSTKTRPGWNPVGMILRRNPNVNAVTCAVKSLWRQVRRRERQGAHGNGVLFWNPHNKRPYSRNVFTSRLKSRIDRVAKPTLGGRRLKEKPSAHISGVSFRKAVIQKLKDMGMQPTQIATYASHRNIQAQMSYVAETYEASGDIAGALYKGLQ